MKKLLFALFILFTVGALASANKADAATVTSTQLQGTTAAITWTADDAVRRWYVQVGSSAGANDIADSGYLDRYTSSYTVGGLPDDGSTVFIQLWERSAAGNWTSQPFTATSGGNGGGEGNNAEVIEMLFFATPDAVQQAFQFGFTLPLLGYICAWALGLLISFASKEEKD